MCTAEHVGSGNPDHRFLYPAQFDKLTRDNQNVALFTSKAADDLSDVFASGNLKALYEYVGSAETAFNIRDNLST